MTQPGPPITIRGDAVDLVDAADGTYLLVTRSSVSQTIVPLTKDGLEQLRTACAERLGPKLEVARTMPNGSSPDGR